MNTSRKIRISERGEGQYNLVIIKGNRTYDQGPAVGNTPKAVFAYAQTVLPNDILDGATWEFRSEAGVYATLDPVKLGWA